MKSLPASLLLLAAALAAQERNKPERLEWFRDQGFGLFIHWSLDSQLGSVISHSMVGASDDYLKRFIEDLPRTFNPRKFQPRDWAVLARLAGIRYVVFTAKHHSGFCMFETKTTDYGIFQTPFRRDIAREILDAFRAEGIAPGLYFSPDDFWWLYRNGKTIQRQVPEVQPRANPGLMRHDQAQIRELLTQYGRVDVIFFDGEPEGLKDLAWDLQPDIVVTRGSIQTPEQYIPGVPLEGAWEANLTMGTQWQYKPTNENYKSGGELISTLIETRAKGGNLLLNAGPKPDGELPVEQEERLREIALWMFLNGESMYAVRPWVVTNEREVWFTRKKDEDTVYAIVKSNERWKYGEWRDFTLHSIAAGEGTEVSVLGQNGTVLEYQPGVIPKATWRQESDGLHIRAMHAQRIYNDRKWPNPIVLKITHAKPALVPPRVETGGARWEAGSRALVFEGRLGDLGKAASVEVGFEYRSIKGLDITERPGGWSATAFSKFAAPGAFTVRAEGLAENDVFEYRAVARHPLLTLYGAEKRVRTR